MNFLASLFAGLIAKPATKLTSWTLRQTEGTQKGSAMAQALAPDVARIAQAAGNAAAAQAEQAVAKDL